MPARSTTAYQRFCDTRFFGSLDGLRALSIIAVVWHHSAAPAVPARWTLLHQGSQGVTLFFVISAFLITTLLVRAKERNTLNVPRFWARRALRIFPLYYAVLALYVVAVHAFERDLAARDTFFANIAAFATFTSNWFVDLGDDRVIFYFAWSLAAEEQFYLCWPWVERVASRTGAIAIAVGVLIVAQVAGWLHASGTVAHLGMKMMASVPAGILVGVVLAHGLNSPTGFARLHAVAARRGGAWLAAAIALLTLTFAHRLGYFSDLAIAVAFAWLVCACVVREDNDLAPVLRVRTLMWIGTVSYGIYLFHMLAVNAFRRAFETLFHTTSPMAEFIGGTVIGIVVATISYRTYEAYFLARKERWLGATAVRPPPRAEQPLAAPVQ